MADKMIERSEFFEYMQAFEERFNGRMQAFEQRINSRVDVHFDETQRLVRLSFEAIDALRETTDRGFADLRRDNHENKTLLEAALTHVRTRVDRLERD